MKEYLSLLHEVLKEGDRKSDRTNTGTISKFGTQRVYDLQVGFPLITTKKVHFKSVVVELLWFIAGDTNIKYLVDNGVRIWNEWPYEQFKRSIAYNNETMEQFVHKIQTDDDFAQKHGDLGPVYGAQWRNFNNEGIDQLKDVIAQIKSNPSSRRLIISAWNPAQTKNMALPPCHAFVQFYVNGNKLSCHLYQRSADLFLGVPFNIASYSLLTLMVAHVTGLQPDKFVHSTGDAHIYLNHLDQVNEQLGRTPLKLASVSLASEVKSIFDFKLEDIVLQKYNHHPAIKAKVAI